MLPLLLLNLYFHTTMMVMSHRQADEVSGFCLSFLCLLLEAVALSFAYSSLVGGMLFGVSGPGYCNY